VTAERFFYHFEEYISFCELRNSNSAREEHTKKMAESGNSCMRRILRWMTAKLR
jgi:hypothetical protein